MRRVNLFISLFLLILFINCDRNYSPFEIKSQQLPELKLVEVSLHQGKYVVKWQTEFEFLPGIDYWLMTYPDYRPIVRVDQPGLINQWVKYRPSPHEVDYGEAGCGSVDYLLALGDQGQVVLAAYDYTTIIMLSKPQNYKIND